MSGLVRVLLFRVGSGSGIILSGTSSSGFGSPNTSLPCRHVWYSMSHCIISAPEHYLRTINFVLMHDGDIVFSVISKMAGKHVLLMQLINILFSRADFHSEMLNYNSCKNYNDDQDLKQFCILWSEKLRKTLGSTQKPGFWVFTPGWVSIFKPPLMHNAHAP